MRQLSICEMLPAKLKVRFYDYNGIGAWATGAWKTTQEGTKAYKDFVDKAREAGISITFEHVKGHSGIAGNEQADQMAKAAVGIIPRPKIISSISG